MKKAICSMQYRKGYDLSSWKSFASVIIMPEIALNDFTIGSYPVLEYYNGNELLGTKTLGTTKIGEGFQVANYTIDLEGLIREVANQKVQPIEYKILNKLQLVVKYKGATIYDSKKTLYRDVVYFENLKVRKGEKIRVKETTKEKAEALKYKAFIFFTQFEPLQYTTDNDYSVVAFNTYFNTAKL